MRRQLLAVCALICLLNTTPSSALADDTGLATSLHATVRIGRHLCMAEHTHFGTGSPQKNKKLATISAIRDWGGFTAWEYGTDWANWKIAQGRTVSCAASASGLQCTVSARACRTYSVRALKKRRVKRRGRYKRRR